MTVLGRAMQGGMVVGLLSAYAGMSVSLQIGMRSDGSVNRSGVYIDDFAITD